MMVFYSLIFLLLLALELLYFRIADRYDIIDKPNARSSHASVVLRGGGIVFSLSVLVWAAAQCALGNGQVVMGYLPFLLGLMLIAGVSFADDVRSLPDSVRLVAQFVAMGLMFFNLGLLHLDLWWAVVVALIVCVGATNVINFMDGINGITAGYSLAVLVPLLLLNGGMGFIDESLLMVVLLSVLVFCLFNFRPRGKARCFAGDVGSIGIAFILLFAIGRLILATGDVTWLILLLVYGVDGCLTICHRIMLRENLGEAHRKHAYQLMANELGMSHVAVSLIYAGLQLAVSLGFVFLCPPTVLAHWVYLIGALAVLALGYVGFMRRYYYLHEAYLASLK